MKGKTSTDALLMDALAKINAAFPAGDYGLNEKQNLAMNALNDAIFRLRHEDAGFKAICDRANYEHHMWVIDELRRKGVISAGQMRLAIKEYQKHHGKEKNGHTRKSIKSVKSTVKKTKGKAS